jgi:plastocyanin
MRQRIATLIVLGLTLAACSNSSSPTAGSTDTTPPASSSSPATSPAGTSPCDAAIGAGAVNRGTQAVTGSKVEIEADNDGSEFYFKPTCVTGSGTVTVEVKNQGSIAHTFTVQALGIDEQIEPGKTKDVSVTFPASGAAPFVCKFHAGSGMRGALLAK